MENLLGLDELQIYRGLDITIVPGITIHQPTLGEICDFGEKKYFSMIHSLTSVGADMKWQLWDAGIDYTKITDYELFYNLLIKNLSDSDTSLVFGDLDFSRFKIYEQSKNGISEIVLYDKDSELIINEYIYTMIVSTLREIHKIKRNNEVPGTTSTKMILIEDAREEYNINKNKKYQSYLKNLISAMTNCEGFKYNHSNVWDMKINAFMDAVRRVIKIRDAFILYQSGHFAYGVDLKKIDNKKLDWIGELE